MPLLARARFGALSVLAASICLCLAMPVAVETRHTADGDVYRLLGRAVPSVVGKALLTAIPIMLVASSSSASTASARQRVAPQGWQSSLAVASSPARA